MLVSDLFEVLSEYHLCLSCMGRQVGMVGSGLTNLERGISLLEHKYFLDDSKKKDFITVQEKIGQDYFVFIDIDESTSSHLPGDSDCNLCLGLLTEKENFVDIAISAVSDYSFSTFEIGSIVDKQILELENKIQESLDENLGESIKTQINREVGILISKKMDIRLERPNPEITILIDTLYGVAEPTVRSLFIEGRYVKLDRTIPQTRWPCRKCRGRGCSSCNETGQTYPESVQSLIAKPFLERSLSISDSFHGMGREDIDARMLGDGRPFILELKTPKKRTLDLDSLQSSVNDENEGRVSISNLSLVDKKRVRTLKNTACDKLYRVKISSVPPISKEKLKKGAAALTGTVVEQRTPKRVSHRRSDLIRKRGIRDVDIVDFSDDHAVLEICAEHGTYIKELVSGDEGRTEPNLSGLVDSECKVERLDVVQLYLAETEVKK